MIRLPEPDAKRELAAAGLAAPRGSVVRSPEAAAAAARALGAPVVVKAVSADLVHKSAAGGVAFAGSPEEAADAYRRVAAAVARNRPEVRIDGVLIEERLSGGLECVLGLIEPPGFGPVVMFGLGGLFVEALGDVAFRLVPLSARDAGEMLSELRGRRLVERHRERLRPAILAFASMAARWREAEVNPLLVRDDGVWALDAVATPR